MNLKPHNEGYHINMSLHLHYLVDKKNVTPFLNHCDLFSLYDFIQPSDLELLSSFLEIVKRKYITSIQEGSYFFCQPNNEDVVTYLYDILHYEV